MKRMIALLLAALLALTLAACGGSPASSPSPESTPTPAAPATPTPAPTPEPKPIPQGLFMLKWIGNQAGEYVEESNVFKDYFGESVNLIDRMWQDKNIIWCQIGPDGAGTFSAPGSDPVKLDFNTDQPGMVLFGGLRSYDYDVGDYTFSEGLVPYVYDEATGVFWFEEQEGYWDVMEPCSQAKLDLVFAGKGGSVPLEEAQPGDLVCLGQFDTDRDREGLEPLFWRVLERDGDKVLLLCDKLIDSYAYNTNPERQVLTDVTWENCTLRAFLNNEEDGFLTLFTPEEIARMQTTHLENKSANEELNAKWGVLEDQGDKTYSDLGKQDRADDPDTDDRVFLLSYQEVLQYFGEPTEEPETTEEPDDVNYPFRMMKVNPAWIATVTDAVVGGYYDNDTRAGSWLTRTLCTSHSDEDMAVYITSTGQVFDYFTYASLFIRPAVWVNTGA